MTGEDRQPWELADDESGDARRDVPPTSEPIEEDERGRRSGSPRRRRRRDPEAEPGDGAIYARRDARRHSRQKGPAGGASGPR